MILIVIVIIRKILKVIVRKRKINIVIARELGILIEIMKLIEEGIGRLVAKVIMIVIM